jgi:AGZA family xanthine/uracil permease-like MFS transporter
MGLVVLDGIVVLLLVLTGLREAVLDAIPLDLRRAMGAGIGLFIAFIGLTGAGIVVPGPEGGPPLTYGSVRAPEALVGIFGLILTAFLVARRVTGALVIGIMAGTLLALALGVARLPQAITPPSFEIALQADVAGALSLRLAPLLFALVMVDFFDTLGTATAIAEQAELQDGRGRIPRVRSVLAVDSVSASIGGLFGVSSVTSYIESAAGVAEGARTGLHSVFVGLMFLLAVFVAPIAGVVPAAATAPALILVGFLMLSQVARVDFRELDTAIPAFIILLTIPLTYSISHGIGYGFIAFALIKLLSRKARDVHPLMYGVAAAFAAWFAWS